MKPLDETPHLSDVAAPPPGKMGRASLSTVSGFDTQYEGIMTTERKLVRSAEDRLICGISGGIAERFDLDPVAVRMGWLVACFLTAGGAALVYVGLCFLIPLGTTAQPVAAHSDPKKEAKRLANLRQEARILLEVRRELGPEYENEQIDAFIEKVNTRLQPPPAPRFGHRVRGFLYKVFWLGILVTGLVMFAITFYDIFGDTLFVISVMIVTIPVISFGIFKLRRGVPD